MTENPYLQNLVPHLARRRDYVPTEDSYITLHLPGEMLRAKVKRVSNPDAIVAEIDSIPMGKSHNYRRGDIVPCRRTVDNFLNTEGWEIVSERELNLAEATARFEKEEREKAAVETNVSRETSDSKDDLSSAASDNWSA